MKKLHIIIISLLLMLAISIPAFASSAVVDSAALINITEADSLSQRVQDIGAQYDCDVVVYTTNAFVSSPATAAKSVLTQLGDGGDGIVFFISMYDRDWYIYTTDTYLFNDDALDMMEDTCVPMLSAGDYNGAFNSFADITEDVLTADAQGESYKAPRKISHLLIGIVIALIIALIAGAITVAVLRSQLTSVKMQHGASGYQVAGSFKLSRSDEVFRYKNISRVPKPKSSGGGGFSGGGGGRGGNF